MPSRPSARDASGGWWRHGVLYQVYPRSFRDANGDGVGDLAGIRERAPYLHALGVDGVWLSPFYRSPMADFGYDVSDHEDVDPRFGTLADFDALAAEARRLGLRLVLDYVPNHTSSAHPWFAAARAGPKRDWYLWRERPNNWVSVFGGPAWTFDEGVGRSYYHAYLPDQPDLNWRNPAVRDAMLGVLRFWRERGADGFRIDALRQLVKDAQFRDNPPNPDWREGGDPYDRLLPRHSTDRPEVQDMVAAMREAAGQDALLVGELYLPLERLAAYYGSGRDMPANFHLLSTPWTAEAIGDLIARYEAVLPEGAWPNWVLGNHDRPRVASRLGPAQARVAAMLLLTLRGTPTLYYGDELGLEDVAVAPDEVQDPWERRVPGQGLGRDPVRTPMPWDASSHAGFCPPGVAPWLPVGEANAGRHVAGQLRDPRSMLALHRRLLAVRRASPALHAGALRLLHARDGLLAWRREHEREQVLVALNLGGEQRSLPLPAPGRILAATGAERAGTGVAGELVLAGDEGLVVGLRP
jgi:alpha-glucosidase